MSEAFLQILLLLAYLAIGLISVTFPIYAICVTYFRREFWESLKEQKKRVENLKENISRLMEELSGERKDSERFKEIERQIKGYKDEVKKAPRWAYLSAAGVVIIPVGALISSLILTCIGIYCYYEGLENVVGFLTGTSVVLCGGAIWSLCKTVSAVEYAVMRPAPSIEFGVCYESREKSQTIKVGQESTLSIGVAPLEQNVENVSVRIFVPPEIEIKKCRYQHVVQPEGFRLPGYTMIIFDKEFAVKNEYEGIEFSVLGKKPGIYEILVEVNGKGISQYGTNLLVNIVE